MAGNHITIFPVMFWIHLFSKSYIYSANRYWLPSLDLAMCQVQWGVQNWTRYDLCLRELTKSLRRKDRSINNLIKVKQPKSSKAHSTGDWNSKHGVIKLTSFFSNSLILNKSLNLLWVLVSLFVKSRYH